LWRMFNIVNNIEHWIKGFQMLEANFWNVEFNWTW
jgi:hypothetical protein